MVRTTTSFVAGAIVALVVGTGTAYAATGGKFIIGRANSASTTTTLSNSGGTALTLNSKAGQPSLRVNRTTKVPYLNSDLLDGLDSSALARATTLGTSESQGFLIDLNDVETDTTTDDTVVAAAQCPDGSQLTGGGVDDFTSDGKVQVSSPGDGAWIVITSASPTEENAAAVTAYARCWNPKANVADLAEGAGARRAPATPSRSAAELVEEFAAQR